MKLLLKLLFALLLSLPLQAQNLLLFPETTLNITGDMPANICLLHSNRLIKSISVEDTTGISQLRDVGRRLMKLGFHEYAREAFEKILDISSKAYPKNDMRYINAYIDLARSYVYLIRYDEMLQMYSVAADLIIKTKGENSYEHALALNEAMEAYFYMRDYNGAQRMSEKVIKILEKIDMKGSLQYAVALNNLAISKQNTGNPAAVLPLYKEAFEILKNPKNPKFYHLAVAANWSETLSRAGDLKAAKELLDKYYPVAEKELNERRTLYARVWLQYGNAFWRAGEFDKAENAFKKAYLTNSLIFTQIKDIAAESDALFFKNQYLATCAQAGATMSSILMYIDKYKKTGDMKSLKDAFALVQTMGKFKKQLHESFTSEKNKLILFRLGATVILEAGIDVAYELYQQTGDKKYLEAALSFSENGKSTLLINALRSKETKRFGNLPESLLKEEAALQQQLKEWQKLVAESNSEKERKAAQQQLAEGNRQLSKFKEMLAEKYPNYYKHYYDEPTASIEEIQKSLKNGEALLEYSLGQNNAYAFILTNKEARMVKLQLSYEEMHTQSGNLRRCLSDYEYIKRSQQASKAEFIAASSYFYQTFLNPLLSGTNNIRTLIVVPDKDLGHLPFEVFLTEKPQPAQNYAQYSYLLQKYAISYTFSATLLLEKKAQDAKAKSIPEKRGVLAFAGKYGDQKQLASAETAKRSADLRSLRQSLQPLPGAEQEVALMDKYLYGEFFSGTEAGEKQFKERAKDYNIIHLAMHGLLDTNEPILSSLAFSEDGDASEDNFLYSYEITQLDLKARLVVLSACETGYGKFNQGEGVMSLAHSFMYAGASSVLVSLWQVNDRSTGEIMKFYYINLSLGMTKSQALQKAKQQYLKTADEVSAHPAFWAAFVQMGDTVPLELVCKAGYTFQEKMLMIGSGLAAVIALIGGYFLFRKRRKG